MRLRRIMAWIHPEQNKEGAGYQAYQAMIALGSGGWNGLGLGNGRQKLGFVPEHHTDFIFSIIGEELGLIATLAWWCFSSSWCCAGFISRGGPTTRSGCCSARQHSKCVVGTARYIYSAKNQNDEEEHHGEGGNQSQFLANN